MAKSQKVKGYGAYWKGDIKNKTIARKNKQYISDQRCLRVYKKQLKHDEGEQAAKVVAEAGNVSKAEVSSSVGPAGSAADCEVKVIRPQVEAIYYVHGRTQKEREKSDHKESQHAEEEVESSSDDGNISIEELESDFEGQESGTEGPESESEGQESESDEQGHLIDEDAKTLTDAQLPNEGATEASSIVRKNNRNVDKRTRKGLAKDNNTQGNQKFTGVYAKALKVRHEQLKLKEKQQEERVNKIKQKKREIREKKQLRYERHRLLGKRTKKGQPIMANVITHLMNKYQRKHKNDK